MQARMLSRAMMRAVVILTSLFLAVSSPVAQAAIPEESAARIASTSQMSLTLRQVSVAEGTMLEYQIMYANTGDVTASDVVITKKNVLYWSTRERPSPGRGRGARIWQRAT